MTESGVATGLNDQGWQQDTPCGCMTAADIAAWPPDALPAPGNDAMTQARRAMAAAGLDGAQQQMGLRWPVGCVALEITQRCNLDCTRCYLSEHSEAVHDLPLEEVFRRIDRIREHYGTGIDVQITGGDPTLRKREELLAIVARVHAAGLRPTLMTNGIRATRALLRELAAAGLCDVAFHVDTTQQRKAYATVMALNAVRQEYLERARGLPLSVFFNTTVHAGNFHEIPGMVRFFARHAGAIRTASFQIAADTGRGMQTGRAERITPDTVARQIETGAGTTINFDSSRIGHPGCNRYGLCFAAGGRLFDALDDVAFIAWLQRGTARLRLERNRPGVVVLQFLRWLLVRPARALPVLRWAGRKAWAMRGGLLAGGGRVRTISFLIHNFMDSQALETERIHTCVFKVMTADGPLSMCMHNARRDNIVLQPVRFASRDGQRYWSPLTGAWTTTQGAIAPAVAPEQHGLKRLKRLKGRTRQRLLAMKTR